MDIEKVDKLVRLGSAITMGVSVVGLIYVLIMCTTGEVNPVRWPQAFQRGELSSQEYAQRYKKLFGKGGLADKNGDNVLEIGEVANAYRRMGPRFRDRIYSVGDQFPHDYTIFANHPNPTLRELDTAIQSYQAGLP